MDIKDVKVGGTYYIPVEVISVDDEVQAYYAQRKDKGLWDDFDAVDMVTKEEVVGTEIDDQVDFWKHDSESAHEEIRKMQKFLNSKEDGMRKIEEYADQLKKIADDLGDENEKLKADAESAHEENRKLQEQVKRLTDSNGQYSEQIQRYDNALKDTENKVAVKIEQLAKSEKRCADLQKQLERLNGIKDEADKYKKLSADLQQSVDKLVADKARQVCVAVKEVESTKVEALRKALKGQGNDIRRKRAIINALAERVVYLEGEMKKNG